MITKELLKQYCDLQKEIKELEQKIERLRNKRAQIVSDSVKGSSKCFPYIERTFIVTGIEQINYKEQQIEKLSNILFKRRAKCKEMALEIEEFINTIPNSKTRRIFSLKYGERLNWIQISRMTGGYEESYARKIHDRYLENLK